MSEEANVLIRKMNARKIALEAAADSKLNNNCGKVDGNVFEVRYQNLIEDIRFAADNSCLSWYKYLSGNKAKVFVKKCIRKVLMKTCGWMITPIIEQQSAFNGKVINALCELKDIALEQQRRQLQERELAKIDVIEGLQRQVKYISDNLNISYDPDMVKDAGLDYFDFENRFRGPRNTVKELQREYVKYYQESSHDGVVLDLGCGRGEFLELMNENDIKAKGIDAYPPFVEYCRSLGFDAECADILDYLNGIDDESLNGIFMGQIVEHLNMDYFRKLLVIAYKKLKKGAYFLVETPNPESLTMYLGFYSDPSHIKPVPYQELEYYFQKLGYVDVRCFHNYKTEYEHKIPLLKGDGIENLEEVNYAIGMLNLVLFGARDYTLIARK